MISEFPKSTLCWLLNEKKKLSNDRSKRYIYDAIRASEQDQANIENSPVFRMDLIQRGDFIVLKEKEKYLLLEVLNFQNFDAATKKAKRISKKFCNRKVTSLAVLGNWHIMSMSGKLIPLVINDYHPIDSYICHANPSFFNISTQTVSAELFNSVFDTEYQDLFRKIAS